jgi:hypothetical protein
MISFLADIFRRMSYVVGISSPPPGEQERQFVFLWLGMIAIVVVASIVFFYLLLHVFVP